MNESRKLKIELFLCGVIFIIMCIGLFDYVSNYQYYLKEKNSADVGRADYEITRDDEYHDSSKMDNDKSSNYEGTTSNEYSGDNYSSEDYESVNPKFDENNKLVSGQKLWNYTFATYWGSRLVWKSHTENLGDGHRSIVCDTTREELMSWYASDFTASVNAGQRMDYSLENFIPKDCRSAGGRGSIQTYKDTYLSIKEESDDRIVYNATSVFCTNSFCHDYDGKTNRIDKEETHDFIIVKRGDKWLIQYFYLPN
ncbi:MAG: hypothetical protein IKF71_01805 [Bacilli bacterium]|nr:hypothetical protein [Bacilli bacterium]